MTTAVLCLAGVIVGYYLAEAHDRRRFARILREMGWPHTIADPTSTPTATEIDPAAWEAIRRVQESWRPRWLNLPNDD